MFTEVPVNGKKVQLMTAEQIDALLHPETQPEAVEEPQPVVAETEQSSVEEPEETDPDYESMNMSDTLADLKKDFNDEEVDSFIAAKRQEYAAAVSEVEKNAPSVGTSKSAYLAARKQYQDELDSVRKKADYWEGVEKELAGVRAAEEAAKVVDLDKVEEEAYDFYMEKQHKDLEDKVYDYETFSEIIQKEQKKWQEQFDKAETEEEKMLANIKLRKIAGQQRALAVVNYEVDKDKEERVNRFRERLGIKEGDRVVLTDYNGNEVRGVVKEFVSDHLLSLTSDNAGTEVLYDSRDGYYPSIKLESEAEAQQLAGNDPDMGGEDEQSEVDIANEVLIKEMEDEASHMNFPMIAGVSSEEDLAYLEDKLASSRV